MKQQTTPKTMKNTTTRNIPPPMSSTPEKNNQKETIPITMQQCKEFSDSEMASFWARLKKQSNIFLPSAANYHVKRPTTTQPPTVPSPMVTSSEEFITKELTVLQANLKKSFP